MNPRIPDTHAEAWALLPWLANGRIGLPDREWVEAHVQSCAECRAEIISQRELAARMSQAGAVAMPAEAEEEQQSFDKLWARVEASEVASLQGTGSESMLSGGRSSRTVRWLAAAVVVQAIGLGILGTTALRGGAQPSAANAHGGFTTVATAERERIAPTLRVVFASDASVGTINTLLAHQGLTIVEGPGKAGNYTAVLSADAVASGATAESVAAVISKDPNVDFAQPVAR